MKVNTASRMESNSEVNRIHCSKAAADLLSIQCPGLPLKSRGEITVKGKGKMQTYWVNEASNELLNDRKPPKTVEQAIPSPGHTLKFPVANEIVEERSEELALELADSSVDGFRGAKEMPSDGFKPLMAVKNAISKVQQKLSVDEFKAGSAEFTPGTFIDV